MIRKFSLLFAGALMGASAMSLRAAGSPERSVSNVSSKKLERVGRRSRIAG